MLPPDNRAVLRDLLRPPISTELVHAVGTTFTVDLTAALVIPLSFAARDFGDHPDQIGVMEAIRSCSDRVDVFYQAGKALVPPANDLFAFLEPVLHPVAAPRPGRLFHPKVWLLKFIDSDAVPSYRLICATRNLTQDRSWDAVITLDGRRGSRVDSTNAPIREFLRSLPRMSAGFITPARQNRINALADEVGRIAWDRPDDAKQIAFYALGIGRTTGLPNFSGYRRLVVSPFVNDKGLGIVAPVTARGTVLVSRPDEIDRLTSISEDTELRVLSLLAELEDDAEATDLGGLHAKLTIVERGGNAHMFLGSANATDAAYGGNVEFLVEVVRGATKYGVEAHLAADTGMGAMLEPYSPQPPTDTTEEDLRFELQDALRRIAELLWTVRTSASGDVFDLHVTSGRDLPTVEMDLAAGLLTLPGRTIPIRAGEPADIAFPSVRLADVTSFVTLSASRDGIHESTVIPAQLLDEPVGRLDAVLARQVDSPEKFLHFLMLLLELDVPGISDEGAGGGDKIWRSFASGQGIFELLARALADGSTALEDLDRLVTRLSATEDGQSRLPEGFLELWTTVNAARALVGAKK